MSDVRACTVIRECCTKLRSAMYNINNEASLEVIAKHLSTLVANAEERAVTVRARIAERKEALKDSK